LHDDDTPPLPHNKRGFFIATSALGFQVFVLYLWHKRLDDDSQELKVESLKVLRGGELLEIEEEIKGFRRREGM
jgi:hypothetical protein